MDEDASELSCAIVRNDIEKIDKLLSSTTSSNQILETDKVVALCPLENMIVITVLFSFDCASERVDSIALCLPI